MKSSILIVDDEFLIRETLARFLSRDYTIFKASNGREAVHMLKENKSIELVLSDIRMPEMDGIELLETIRTDNSEMVVILMTAVASIGTVADARKKSAYDCLSKPLDLNKLQITIKNALENKGLRHENTE